MTDPRNPPPQKPSALRKQPTAVAPLYPVGRLRKAASLEADAYRQQAQQELEAARAEAQQIRADAQAQAARELEAARQEGHAQATRQFAELLTKARAQVAGLSDRFSDEVTQIAFRLAREVLDIEFTARPEQLAELVSRALDEVRTRMPQRMCVHLHPDDLEIVASHRATLAERLPRTIELDFVADETLSRRDVIIETEMGHYSLGVDSQLGELRKLVLRPSKDARSNA